MMKQRVANNQSEAGFTILELMIATSILSILLLIASAVFISIGSTYTKGVTGTNLQDNVRDILQNVSGTAQYSVGGVQFLDGTGPNGESAYCIGTEEYSFIPDEIQGVADSGKIFDHVLWADPIIEGTCPPPEDLSSNGDLPATGKDLGIAHEGIHQFLVNPGANGLVTVTVDAFQAAGLDQVNLPAGANSSCNGGSGDQYCFTSFLQTSVTQRVQ